MTTMTRISKPIVCAESIASAAHLAEQLGEPVIHPVRLFTDDRGWSMMNQFQDVLSKQGQVNYSLQYPGVIKAWHRHARQTDFWLCVRGMMKVGIHRQHAGDQAWMAIVGEMSPSVVVIPPTLWHGVATIGNEPAGLLYYVTQQYDSDHPDEERRPWDAIDFPWQQVHK